MFSYKIIFEVRNKQEIWIILGGGEEKEEEKKRKHTPLSFLSNVRQMQILVREQLEGKEEITEIPSSHRLSCCCN